MLQKNSKYSAENISNMVEKNIKYHAEKNTKYDAEKILNIAQKNIKYGAEKY